MNVSIPEAAARAAATGADGVGLLRIEHLILGLNKTPGWFITNNKEEEFVRELHDGIKIVLDAFPGKTGLGADTRCPDRRVPEHEGRRERTARA